MADNRIKSVFGAYAENLQVLVDTRAEKFAPTFYQNVLDWGTPQMQLSFAMVIGRQRIEAAASVIAHSSAAPLRSRTSIEKYNGEVSAIEVSRTMLEEDYRNYLAVQQMNVDNDAKKTQILKLIWDDVEYCANAVNKRLDIMTCQALSTGKITIDVNSNPDGIVTGDIDLLMPTANIQAATTLRAGGLAWIEANYLTAKPISDIQAMVKKGEDVGVSFAKIYMPKALFYIFQNFKEVIDNIKGFYRIEKGSLNPTLVQINEYLTANMLPVIELIDVVTNIEKDGLPSIYRPWEQNNITFVPAGKLGTVYNALNIEQLNPVSGVSYATAKNVFISKWASNNPFQEWTKGALKAIPGISAIDSIFIFKTNA